MYVNEREIPVFAVTGGPCAGKTTGMSYVSQKLSDRGFCPLFPVEAATLLMNANLSPITGAFSAKTFQRAVIKSTKDQLETFLQAAHECTHPKPVIIPDRLYADAEPYCGSTEVYEEILQEFGIKSRVYARDEFCDAVFHLRSAALGAEEFYSSDNNAIRRETLGEARDIDERTLQAWNGHRHLRIIDNSTDFAGKMARLDQQFCVALGIPVPQEKERKFLCAPFPIEQIPVPTQRIEIEQFYIYSADPNVVLRVRKRGQFGSHLYFKTAKTFISHGVNNEVERFIRPQEYNWSLDIQLPMTRIIQKHRYCFIYENQYFELDLIPMGDKVVYLLEIELTDMADKIIFPPFLPIEKEVTDDPRYTNRALADLGWPNVSF